MKIRNIQRFLLILTLGNALACQHAPIYPPGYIPPNDEQPTGLPCNPDTVYFVNQVLPLLISNCAMSGCHDAQTRADGIQLTSYATVMQSGEVKAGDPGDSDLYEKLLESRNDKRMPPPPYNRLSSDKIELIRKWIAQGARNNSCIESGGDCDTTSIGYAQVIAPIISNNCLGCHSGTNPSGGIQLSSLNAVQAQANAGRLLGAIQHSAGFTPMPPGSSLTACQILQITAWINQGQNP